MDVAFGILCRFVPRNDFFSLKIRPENRTKYRFANDSGYMIYNVITFGSSPELFLKKYFLLTFYFY